MSFVEKISVVNDPKTIKECFPDGPPWQGRMTPTIHVMKDGEPLNNPETGEFQIPRVQDPSYTKTASRVRFPSELIEQLVGEEAGKSSLLEKLGMELFDNVDAARRAHADFDWSKLGVFL